MSKLDEMKAVSQLEQHRQTLLVEVCDIHMLVANALNRLANIQSLCSESEYATVLANYWQGVLTGTAEEEEIKPEDIVALVVAGTGLLSAIESIEMKRCMFGLPPSSETGNDPM